jgi:hypothetical protein
LAAKLESGCNKRKTAPERRGCFIFDIAKARQVLAFSDFPRVDAVTGGVYTREFSNLSSLGLKRSLVCFAVPASLSPMPAAHERRFTVVYAECAPSACPGVLLLQ